MKKTWILGISSFALAFGAVAATGAMAVPMEAKAASEIMKFDFEESSAHRTSGSNSYSSNSYEENSVAIELTYADSVTTGTPIGGAANVLARVAKNTTNSPVIALGPINLEGYKVSQIQFDVKGSKDITLSLEYSTDSVEWTSVYSAAVTSSVNTKTSAVFEETEPTAFMLRFTGAVGSSATSNRDFQLDNIVLLGDSVGDVALESIACPDQAIDVAESVDLADAVTFTPANASDKTVSYSVKSGSDNVRLTGSVVTGLKGGEAVITITPNAEGVDAIDVPVTVSSIAAPDVTVGEKYAIYAEDPTNGSFELSGVSDNLGTAVAMTGSVPSCDTLVSVEAGYFENTVALKLGEKYLALNSSANAMHLADAITEKSSWMVTLQEDGTSLIRSAAFPTRAVMFNYNKGSTRFAVYSITSGMVMTKLYHYVETPLTDFAIPEEMDIYLEESKTIDVTYIPADAFDKAGIVWSSKNTDVATVDENGTVTGVALGDALIEAKKTIGSAEVTRTCTVHVLNNVASHEGTAADPFNVADAVGATQGVLVKTPSGAAIDLANEYYVKGVITANVTRTTSQLSFWIGDDSTQTNAASGGFEVFRAGKVYGVALVDAYETNNDVVDRFDVGYSVVVKGIFVLYKDTTAETSSGTADIVYNDYIEAWNFAAPFNARIETACDREGVDTDLEELKDVWGDMSVAFAALAESEQAKLRTAIGFADGTNQVRALVSKYDYLVDRYDFEDFMHREPASSGAQSSNSMTKTTSSVVLVAAIVSISALTIGAVVYFGRKRHQN